MTTRVRNNLSAPTRLVGALTSGATTINVDSTDGWPTPGGGEEALGCLSYPNVAALELFTYTGKTSTSFTGVTRGADDTDPKAHPARALVVHVASAADISAAAGATELDDLTDVDTSGAADGEVLTYDSGTSSWVPAAASTVAALDDLTDVDVAAAVTGDRLVYDGSEWGPEPAEYVQFVYNSSGGQAGNRFNDWSDLMGVLGALAGPKLILFEQDETIPAGAWDLDNVELRGNGKEYNAGGYTLTFGDSTTISSWENPKVNSMRLLSTSTTGAVWSPVGATSLQIESLAHVHSTTEPFISHSGAGPFVISMRNSARWRLLSGGVENLETTMAAFEQLIIFRGDNSVVDDDTLASTNGVLFIDIIGSVVGDPAGYPSTHTNLNVGFGLALNLTFASALGFDPTGLAAITGTNVQAAIEELDAAVDAVADDVAALPTLASGTYTPTATGVSNVDSITVNPCTYSRVGDIVTVAGFFSVNHTTNGLATVMRLSLPIASNLANQYDLGGSCGAEDQLGGMVEGDETNNEALFRWVAPTSASRFVGFVFQYPVV